MQLVLLFGGFFMFEKSIISSDCFLWVAPWVIPPRHTLKKPCPGASDTCRIFSPSVLPIAGSFIVETTPTSNSFQSSCDLPVVFYHALPVCFGNVPAAACAR